jgi:hypothetical protein
LQSSDSDLQNAGKELVWQEGNMIIYDFLHDLENHTPPEHNSEFELHVFGDLKKYIFYYCFYFVHPSEANRYEIFKVDGKENMNFDDLGMIVDPCGKPNLYGLPVRNAILRSKSEITKINDTFFKKIQESKENPARKREMKTVDLGEFMEPEKLSEQAALLNLNLMTWRMAPELDLELISNKTFLILGCGTLGCNVIRCLIVSIYAIIYLRDGAQESFYWWIMEKFH